MHTGGHAALAGPVHHAVALADRRRVAHGVDLGVGDRAQRAVGDHPAALVDGQARGGGQRGDAGAAGPQHRVRRNAGAVREFDAVRQHLDHLDAGEHPHAEPGERRVQVGLGLRVHARARLLPPQQHHLEFRVPLGDLRGGFDAGEAAAADHDGPAVEPGQPGQPVGEEGRVLRAVEGVGVVVDAGDGDGVRDAAQAVDQGVVAQHPVVVDPYGLRVGVHGGDPAADEGGAGAVEQLRDVHLGRLLAGRGHVQPEPLGEGVVRVDQRHAQVPALPGAGRELDRRGEPGVTGAQDQNLVDRNLVPLRCRRVHRCAASFVSVVPAVRTTTRRKLPFRS